MSEQVMRQSILLPCKGNTNENNEINLTILLWAIFTKLHVN